MILSLPDLIDSISFGSQVTDISTGRYPNGTGPFVIMPPTFEAQNSISTPVSPGDLVINEFMASNQSNMADQNGEYDDWLELHNTTSSPINLAGFRLSDLLSNNSMWIFPDTFIAPNDYLIIWLDNQEFQTGLHTNFKLSGGGEELGLWDLFGNVVDTITFGAQSNNITTGRYPNGTGPFMFLPPTFHAQNLTTLVNPGDLVINEFMAENQTTMTDQNGEYDDWIELYNTTNNPIDLTGFTLSDNLGISTMWTFPDTFIAAQGYLIIWADDQIQPGLHANFKLGAGGEEIGLWDNFGGLIDSITFGAQSADITTGRFPNGTGPFMNLLPTFHAENSNAGASIDYALTTYCVDDTDPTPTISGVQGGTFTASPAGLTINSTTGTIDLSTSTLGVTFTITYTYVGGTATETISIIAVDNASFNYSITSVCENGIDPVATITGLPGGTFSSTAGLALNSSTGLIDASTSTIGTYNVTYTTSGTCPSSTVIPITINPADDASFTYNSTTICQNGADPVATITGLSGGTFSSTAGLVINSSTGLIDASASTAGTYNVTYTTTGACPNSTIIPITIIAANNASFSYNTTAACQSGADPIATITGLQGGTFSSTAGLSINSNTGLIDASASTAGTYNVTYTTGGACPSSSIVAVTINAPDDASFNYNITTICEGTASSLVATITGQTGGFFTSAAGLMINSNTGLIDVASSAANTYNVTYTTTGACPNSSVTSVTITPYDDASYAYDTTISCQNGNDLIATVTGLAGGTFSSIAGLSVDSVTGLVDVSASTAGTYDVVYTTNGPCPDTTMLAVTISAMDDASFTYGGATFCQSASDPSPTIASPGGTFSSTAGLVINASTGIIDVSASTPGTYNLTYTTNGSCPNLSSLSITIATTGNSAFSYTSNSYCQNEPNPIASIGGNPGGLFTATAGLVINNATGEIDLAASAVGNYTITYTVSGACPSSTDVVISITAADIASFAYADTTICINVGVNPIIAVTGATSGTYTAAPAGLVFVNNSTGEIDLTGSLTGNYVITYTSNGLCPAIVTVNVDLSTCGSVRTVDLAASYQLFPNPNTGSFTIENNGTAGNLSIHVYDVLGRSIHLQESFVQTNEQCVVQVEHIVPGVYFVEIKNGDRVETFKIRVEK